MKTRVELEDRERSSLAPYAQISGESASRRHPEPPHPHRLAYERDRARIIHSRAFRRLERKTQVFLNGTGDHLRTRLTHTIALAHDLGHPPFGHSGEEVLDEVMRPHGGFDHNVQSLRIVELIEQKYPRFPGLNLSFEVLEGLQKHAAFYDPPARGGERHPSPSLEAQIANLADEITYYSLDLDDGLDFQLITPTQLAELEVWTPSFEEVRRHFPRLRGRDLNSYVIRSIIDRQVQDVIATSAKAIAKSGVQSVEEVRRRARPLIRYSASLLRANKKLRRFLYANLYFHPRVAEVNQRACRLLREVFDAYLAKPALLGKATASRVEKE